MSEHVRIALVAEGPTDQVFIRAALEAVLDDTISFELTVLQPKTPSPFGGSVDATERSTTNGWGGVYQWCSYAPMPTADTLLKAYVLTHDLLIIHVDVDVSRKQYSNYRIQPRASDASLPCAKECPPASDSADALQRVVQSWLPASVSHENLIFCLPADSLDTWVYAIFFSGKKPSIRDLECSHNIEPRVQRILPKTVESYKKSQHRLKEGWPLVEVSCPQGKRFADSVRAALNSPW